MNRRCHREDQLLDALGRGFLEVEIREHLIECASCSELRLVAGELLDDKAETMAVANVPSAGTMWWRMQLRQRREAESRASRSLLVGQAITFAVALALLIAVFGPDLLVGIQEIVTTIRFSTPLLIAVATWAVIAPIFGWAALRQK